MIAVTMEKRRTEPAIRVDCGDYIDYRCRNCKRSFLHESPKSETMGVSLTHRCRCGTINTVKPGYYQAPHDQGVEDVPHT